MQNKSKFSQFKTIGIIDHFPSRDFLVKLSKLLKKKHNSEIHIYCNDNAFEFYNKKKIFDSINIIPNWLDKSNFDKRTSQENLELSKLEKKYMPISFLSIYHRQLGRGFSFNAINFPRKFNEKIPIDVLKNFYQKQIFFWENEFKKRKIKILLNATPLEAIISRRFKIYNRYFLSSRYKSFYTWYTDEFWNNFLVKKQFYSLKKEKLNKKLRIKNMPNWNRILYDEIVLKYRSFYFLIFKIYKKLEAHFYLRVIKSKKTNYKLFEEIRYMYRTYKNINYIFSNKLKGIDYLENKKVVFFPLQVEPERNLQGNSPEFFNQTELLLKVAKYLPHDVFLVVKEHWISAGVRSNDFYKTLRLDFPNIIFLNAKISGLEIVKKSVAVVTINSSAGLEGALMGKPVLSFSRHNYFNFLNHVFVIKSDKDIHEYFKRIFSNKFDKISSRNDGYKLGKAIEKSSVHLPKFSYSNSNITDMELFLCYKKLLHTFN